MAETGNNRDKLFTTLQTSTQSDISMPSSKPIVLSPATPSELLSYIIAYQRYPTTILIGWPKQVFVEALVEDVKQQLLYQRTSAQDNDDEDHQPPISHPLQHASLLQIAVSRHIRLAFVSTVTHLRAYLATFSAKESKIPPPPNRKPPSAPPLLLVYGLLELHRDGSEWSAQGIGTTAACLIETAARNSFRAAIAEPRGALGYDVLDQFLDENVPLLSGSSSRRSVSIRRVLGRWFEFEAQRDR